MRALLLVLAFAIALPFDAEPIAEPVYVNVDRGWIRDPYAGPQGEPASFDSIDVAKALIASAKTLEGEAIGFAHRRSRVHAAHEFLARNADQSDILELLHGSNPVATCYAIMALTDRMSPAERRALSTTLIEDHRSFEMLHYDIGSMFNIADCMVEYWYSKFNDGDRDRLAAYLLNGLPPLRATQLMLVYWNLDDRHYTRVRELYENGVEYAVVALAGFQRESDLPELRKALDGDTFTAAWVIARFPHESFIPRVESMLDREIRDSSFFGNFRAILPAVLEYSDDQAMSLLVPYLEGKKGKIEDLPDKAATIFQALDSSYRGRHLDLKMALFDSWHGITPAGLRELEEYDARAVTDVAVRILTARPEAGQPVSYDLDVIYVFDELLMLVEKHRPDALEPVLRNATARSDINTLPSAASMLLRHRPEGAADVLLYLVREARQPSILARAIGTLEVIDPDSLSIDVVEQNSLLRQRWKNWQGQNCAAMIEYHVDGKALQDRLKRQCSPESD